MVNKTNMRKWVEALRSANYVQGKGTLRHGSEYCCLGVACEIAIQNGVNVLHSIDADNADNEHEVEHYYDNHDTILPESVSSWLGLDPTNPLGDPVIATSNESLVTATTANDRLGWDFPTIANAIETFYHLNEDDNAEQD